MEVQELKSYVVGVISDNRMYRRLEHRRLRQFRKRLDFEEPVSTNPTLESLWLEAPCRSGVRPAGRAA